MKNIRVGEVWLLAGQSNMQRLLSETANGEAAIAAADHPLIRLFNISRQVAFKHQPPPLATWQACSPESVKQFSAAGYYFGVELEKELRVPIGLINSSYGALPTGMRDATALNPDCHPALLTVNPKTNSSPQYSDRS